MLYRCVECGHKIPRETDRCPNCGTADAGEKASRAELKKEATEADRADPSGAGRLRLEEARLKRAQEREHREHLGRRRTLMAAGVSLGLISILMVVAGANLDDIFMRAAYFLAFAAGVGALFCLEMAFFRGA